MSTEQEVARVAAKSMRYEQGVTAGTLPGLRKAALLSVGGWVDSRPLLDSLAGEMPTG